MADDSQGAPAAFSKPPLKRGLKKPPGAESHQEHADTSSQGSSGSLIGFSPADAKQAFNSPPSQILSHIYLGSQYNAASKKQLGQLQVKRILDLKERHQASDISDLNIHAVPMSDHGDTSITEILPECFTFIEEARTTNETVLVHCRGGVNRSATVVLAYLMKHCGMRLKEAWDHVRSCRPAVQPVPDYMRQLRLYEESIYGSVSLEEQEVAVPLSLNQRIGAWREQNRKNGSMPADLSSGRGNNEVEIPSDAIPSRANTSPLVGRRLKKPPPSSSSSSSTDAYSSSSPSHTTSSSSHTDGDIPIRQSSSSHLSDTPEVSDSDEE